MLYYNRKEMLPMPLETYCTEKLELLEDFYIFPTQKEIDHMKSLKTEVAVDNYCTTLFEKHL